ncbi:hypothetical protein GCM10009756_14560 [Pseudokineococcus marinus]
MRAGRSSWTADGAHRSYPRDVVLWLTGAPGLAEEVADELWAVLPGARVVDPGPLDAVADAGASALAVLEGSPGWRGLLATASAELAAWRSERLVVPRPVLDERLWGVVEAGLLRAGLDGVLVALDADDEEVRTRVSAARVAVGPRLRELERHARARPWLHLRADVVVATSGLSALQVARAVAGRLGMDMGVR